MCLTPPAIPPKLHTSRKSQTNILHCASYTEPPNVHRLHTTGAEACVICTPPYWTRVRNNTRPRGTNMYTTNLVLLLCIVNLYNTLILQQVGAWWTPVFWPFAQHPANPSPKAAHSPGILQLQYVTTYPPESRRGGGLKNYSSQQIYISRQKTTYNKSLFCYKSFGTLLRFITHEKEGGTCLYISSDVKGSKTLTCLMY